jgi:hypothetical protein
MNSSKFSNPSLFDAKMMYCPDGWMYGRPAHGAEVRDLPLIVPSRFIVHTSAMSPASSKRRQMIRLPSGEKNGPPS